MRYVCLILLFCAGRAFCATLASDGSQSDVASKISSAVDGDIVTLPSGSFTWTTGVTISGKGIHIQGAGSGRIIARSTSSVAVGTGTKVFTIASGLSISNGTTLRIFNMADTSGWPGSNPNGRANFMEGTVTTYSGTTLTMSISSTGGSGTLAQWLVATTSATTIIHNSSAALFAITYDATHHVEVSDLKIAAGTGTGELFNIGGSLTAKTGKFHDMWLENAANQSDVFRMTTSRGVFWNLSVDASPFEDAELAWHVNAEGETSSWETASTWGASDTGGTRNVWIEDCDIHNFLHFSDFDNNARAGVRHCLLHHTSVGTHGQDTSYYGVRHVEVTDSTFEPAVASGGYPINEFILLRGGTMLMTDCVVPDLRPGDSKPELSFGIYMLKEAQSVQAGQSWTGGWGQNIPGIQYPGPHQIGFGYVTGTGVDGVGNSTYKADTAAATVYVGDSEPTYFWNNTGSGAASPGIAIDDTSDGGLSGGLDDGTDYFILDRDYFINSGAKPGYTKLTYPHPLRSGASGGTGSSTFSGSGTTVTSGSGTTTFQ